MDSSTSLYRILRVNTQKRQIRLLDLHPGRRDEILECTLRVVNISSQPSYEALSYTWGDSKRTNTIRTNGTNEIKIGKNLYSALRCLRQKREILTIWVDAICIDQSNVRERSEQISLMGDVYRQATSVLVWLGEPGKNAQGSTPLSTRRLFRVKPSVRDYMAHAETLDKAISSTEPRWSTRQWVIQEFVLASHVYLCFGSIRIAYDKLALQDLLLSRKTPLPNVLALHEATSDMVQVRLQISERAHSIAEAALYTSNAAATDPKDKVFSLLNMINPEETSIIGSNYEMSAAEIFARATYASLVVQNDYSILGLVDFATCRDPCLPTWTVNFESADLPSTIPSRLMFNIGIQMPLISPGSTVPIKIDEDAKNLAIGGIPLDRIIKIIRLPGDSNSVQNLYFAQQLISIFQESLDLISFTDSSHVRVNRENVHKANPSVLIPGGRDRIAVAVVRSFFLWWDSVTDFHASPLANQDYMGPLAGWTDGLLAAWQYAAFAAGQPALFVTSEGLVGVSPAVVTIDDEIVVIRNSKLPMIVRRSMQNDAAYIFRGLAYVHGIMNGELLEDWHGTSFVEKHYNIK